MYIRLMENGIEGMLEPFYDGGESYQGHQKYAVLANYKVTPEGAATQGWATLSVKVMPYKTTTLERECDINVGRFDEIYMRGKIPADMKSTLKVNDEIVLQLDGGKGDNAKYYGKLPDRHIKKISMEFENKSDSIERVNLWYLGVRDSAYPTLSEQYGDCTIPDWEGCFADEVEIKATTNVFVDEGGDDALRAKMKSKSFSASYEAMKKRAYDLMDYVPEPHIGKTLDSRDGVPLNGNAETLAFVGFIEKDVEMLKLAARCALSLASCEYWIYTGKDTIEDIPGITWHHRSFQERLCAISVAMTLEFAGSVLTWHGRNILYDSLIMKALPRMDQDFKIMEYIYYMNQGPVFSNGYTAALTTLARRYPRYSRRVDEIEADLNEMMEKCINPDGGMMEGMNYWTVTVGCYLNSACMLAKYRGKSLKEYVGDRLNKTSDFALLLTTDDNMRRTVGDARRVSHELNMTYFMALITGDRKWCKFTEDLKKVDESNDREIFYLIFAGDETFEAEEIKGEDRFVVFPDTGYTYLRRGGDEFIGISGRSFSHCHPDRGSFMIDSGGKPILIDRGMCNYSDGPADKMSESRAHNLAVPVVDGIVLSQNAQHGYSAEVVKSEYENGVFAWISDNNNVWDKDIVIRNVRTITSDKPFEYIITDEFEFTRPAKVLFNLNMYDNEHIEAEPVNWQPEKSEYVEYHVDFDLKPVMQQRFLSAEGTSFALTTKIRIKE